MKKSEAKTKMCPFGFYFMCMCEKCMAWENTSFGTNIKDDDKEGYCKRLEK